jgi:hypothetical protein
MNRERRAESEELRVLTSLPLALSSPPLAPINGNTSHSHNLLLTPGAGRTPVSGALICGRCGSGNILPDYDYVSHKPELKCISCGSRDIRRRAESGELLEPLINKPKKFPKYFFTDEIDAQIRKVYRENLTGKGQVRELAKRLELPRWRISKRARQIEAYEPRIKELNWSEAEIRILKKYAYLTPERIQIHLKKTGFVRSITGVLLKRKRMRFLKNLKGHSAHQLIECFGVDEKTVTRWIFQGLLKAAKRGTHRTELQGGDIWFIKEKDIRRFIIENIGIIDIRKVDKFWFVEIMTGNNGAT